MVRKPMRSATRSTAGLDGDVVELGALGRPEIEVRVEGDAGEAVAVGREGLRDAGLRDADGDLLRAVGAVEADPAGDVRLRALLELDASSPARKWRERR